jgi:hypothetical protein
MAGGSSDRRILVDIPAEVLTEGRAPASYRVIEVAREAYHVA